MSATLDTDRILDLITPEKVLELEQALIRIPSSSFQEHEIADFLASYMSDMRLDVEMMKVANPRDPDSSSRQPIGRYARRLLVGR